MTLSLKFGIIGCGISGIVSGRYCKKNNYHYTIFEKNSNIGGVWYDKSYPNVKLQTNKYSYAFSDFPHSIKTNLYPSREELIIYFNNFFNYRLLYFLY